MTNLIVIYLSGLSRLVVHLDEVFPEGLIDHLACKVVLH